MRTSWRKMAKVKVAQDKRVEEITELLDRGQGKPRNWLVDQLAHLMAKREGQAQARGAEILKLAKENHDTE